jgi:hypothetical protein
MLPIDQLIVMQQSIRDREQIKSMVEYATAGGLWTQQRIDTHAKAHGRKAYPIYITRFPDGDLMIHDGHHRVMATCIAGRHALKEEEYVIRDWNYESYNEVAFDRGYVTPFDPKTEVRLDDFADFKVYVLTLALTDKHAATEYVWNNPARYKEDRKIRTVLELAEHYKDRTKDHFNQITAVAIKLGNEIHSAPKPNRHHHIIQQLARQGIKPHTGIQGFLTENKIFLNRSEAATVALSSGQITKLNTPPDLFSEDLW